MPTLDPYLKISRCPHCSIDSPNLEAVYEFNTTADNGSNSRIWKTYKCKRCGGVVTAYGRQPNREMEGFFPKSHVLSDVLPSKVKAYLQQAIDSVFSPSGAVMLCASSVDAMLKEKALTAGSLYKRIDEAVTQGILTPDMAKWAHQVRLDANDERHADENATLPTTEDAEKAIEFTKTLAELLFVLPDKITRGIIASKPATAPTTIISANK